MGKSVINNDPFAYKPEYNQQVSGAKVVVPPNSKAGENDPFAYRPEYNADVKKKVGGTESEIGITEPVPTQSELQSKKENATSFLISDINKNDFFSKLAAQTDQYFPHTTPQRVNEQAAQVTQQEVFKNPNSLKRYTDQRIKDLNEELTNIQREQNKLYENIAIGADVAGKFTRSVKDQKRYDELAQQALEKEQYKRQLKNNVAELAADQIISQMDLSAGMDFGKIGRQVSSIADPEQEAIFKMAEKGGKTLPGIKQEQMNYTGLQAIKSYLSRNPNIPNYDQVVKNINDLESDFDERNPQTTALRVREKIGAQLYKEGKSSFFGFGYSPNTLKEVADNPETALTNSERKIFNEVVLPTERKLIGTDIPTSGFTRSFYNAIEKGGIGMGKTLGDVTGLRNESDQAEDVLTQEQAGARYRPAGESPTAQGQLAYLNAKEKTGKLIGAEQQQKKELENYTYVRNNWSKFKDGVGDLTGQVAMIALATKGLGGIGKTLIASGAEGGLLGGMTRSAVGQALSNETVGLFTTSYLNAYDNYKQQAIQLMPGEDQAAQRNAYATVMSSVEALSERIFPDTKILTAFTKGVAPTIKDISTKFITREITQQVAREEMQKALTVGLKTFGKEYLKSTGQEATEEAVVDIAQGIADSTFGGQPFDIVKTGQQALNTFLTTALYSPIVAGMAGRGAMRQQSSQNTFMKSAITDMAANPAQYLQSVEDLQLDGTITQQQANEKIQLIKSANKYLQEIPPSRTVTTKTGEGKDAQQIDQNKPFDYPETSSYLLHRLNEGILTEQIENTTDEVVKSKLQKDLKRSQEIRKGLFDGTIGVTPDLKEVIDNDEKADELGIFNTNQVQPDELIGTPFEQQNKADEKQVSQETIPASEEGGSEEITAQVATERNESQGDEVLTEQDAEPIAEASLELTEEDIQKPLEKTRAKKVSGALRDFATKIQKVDITGAGGTAAQSDITKVPREVMAFAINRVADAIDAGEAVVSAIQKGVDYIREQGHKMEDESFSRYTRDLIEGRKPRVKISTTPERKKESKVIDEKGDIIEEWEVGNTDVISIEMPDFGTIELTKEDNNTYSVSDVNLKQELRGKGLGKKLYHKAIEVLNERGLSLVPGHSTSPAALRVWKSLEKEGLVTIESIKENDNKDYIGDFVVKAKTTGKLPNKKSNTKEQTEEKPEEESKEPPKPPKAPPTETESGEGGNIDDYEMTTSGEVNRFLSGDTWEDIFGEEAEGDQNYLTQKLSDMLQDGKNMIAIAQQRWGGDVMMYGKNLFKLIQSMSDDAQLTNKKAVLLATFLGELQEAKKRSPERFDAISQLEKAVFAYYQRYMNLQGKRTVAGRLVRLYRDKYIGDIYADRILEKEQVKAKKAIQEIEQNVEIDDKIASEEIKPITEEEKKKEDKAAKKKTETAKKEQSKKKKMTNEEAKQRADTKVREIEEKMGKDGRGGLISRIKEAIKKLNCK
jgi:predicted GNAT family acetyltransferase